ncbi:MAG TPA: type VI secretion system contractile sheath large subunit [Bryobacteraceae bacterium]|nr:type VI secretion system contractile sheath large subunit [Bryobacteraceae bacterium]
MSELQSNAARAALEPVAAQTSLLDKILEEGRLAPTPEERTSAKTYVEAFVEQLLTKEMTVSKDTEAMLNARIAVIDQAVSNQLNEIMHAEPLQRMEAAWRGLHYFVFETETSPMLKIKVMNVGKKELLKDLRNATEFDQSTVFKKVHDEGYGVLGGHPFGALIGDYEFGRHPEDTATLEKMSNVAAAAHAPFIAACSPKMFNWDSFTELTGPRDLAKIFDNDAYLPWKTLRESEDSRYVALTLPHILLRLPYGRDTRPVEEFDFEESVDGNDHRKYLWGNSAYAFATRVTDAFARHEWCAAIRGVEGGGLVEGLPTHVFATDDGDIAVKCPTEVAITDRRENEFSKLGFIPLCYYKGTDRAAFLGAQSCQKPVVYLNDDANANARLSAQLQYTFAITRFAHFLKSMMRDKIGSFMSRENCEHYLNEWISHYVLLDDTAGHDAKAKFPLREARIEVTDVAGKPGVYNAVAYLRPHFQLDELTVSLRLVARLPETRK